MAMDFGRRSVVMMPSGIQASTVAELSEQLWYSLGDSIDRKHTTDHAGGSDEDMV